MNPLNRLFYFSRDLIEGMRAEWSRALTNDCDRNGGHQWTTPATPFWPSGGLVCQTERKCKRCHVTELVRVPTTTNGTGTTYTYTT